MSGIPNPPAVKYLEREIDDLAHEFYRRLEQGELATTRCEGCRETSFPPRSRCPSCGGSAHWVTLPGQGRLHAFTTQERALRFTAPSVLALAEFGDAVVPGIVEERYETLSIGQPVEVDRRPEPETGLTLLRFVPVAPGNG